MIDVQDYDERWRFVVYTRWEILQEPAPSRVLFLWMDGWCGAKEPPHPSGLESREERVNKEFAGGNQRMHRPPLVIKQGLG